MGAYSATDAAIKIGSESFLGSAGLDSIKASDGTAIPELLSARVIRMGDGTTGILAEIYLPNNTIAADTDTVLDRYKHFLPGTTVKAATNQFYKVGAVGVSGAAGWALVAGT